MATTPQRLNDRHEAAARLFAIGMRRSEIARQLGYYPTTLSAIRRSPAFQTRLASLHREVKSDMFHAFADRIVNLQRARPSGEGGRDSRT